MSISARRRPGETRYPATMFATLLLAACTRTPDLVLVTLDTTRRDSLGAYGGPPSPTFDRLADGAARYDDAYTVVPLTIPAHAALLTGRWPTSTGIHDNDDHVLAPEETTMAEVLSEAGYDTAAFVGARMLGHDWGFDQGFATFDAPTTPERRADAVVDAALAWLAADHHGKPIFLWVHLYDAHAPYDAPVDPAGPPPPADPYLAEVAYADRQLGRLFTALEARKGWDRAGFVIVGDHGEGRGDHGEREHGALTFASTTNVPLLVRAPGGSAGTEVDQVVSTIDLLPTMLSWTSVRLPPGVDGIRLGPEPSPAFVESHYLARHLGWSPIDGYVEPAGTWLRTNRMRRFDRTEAELPTAMPLTDTFDRHYAAPSVAPAPQGPADLSALAALGYLDATVDRHVAIDPIDGIGGYEALKDAAAALAAGDEPAATAALAIARATDPDGPAVRLLAVGLHGRSDPAGALPEAQALLRDAPSARARATVSELLARTGQLQAAAPYLRDAARELPPDARQMGLLGLALADAHDKAATDWLQRSLTANPDQPLLRAALGRIALEADSPAAAVGWLQDEVDRFPPALDARKALVQALLGTGRWSEALTALNELDALRPPDSGSAFARAVALHHLGDDVGARKALTTCLAAKPTPAVCTRAAAGRW